MADSAKADVPILAAGGIVFRQGSRPRVAVVRLRRDKSWVLPKGKLYPGERASAAAKREVVEETGHEVSVHEFLGSMSYPVGSKIKIVQFWHMRVVGGPVRELASEIKAVEWLPLKQAIKTLTRAREKVFLANVAPAALKSIKRSVRDRLWQIAVTASEAARVFRSPQQSSRLQRVSRTESGSDGARASSILSAKTKLKFEAGMLFAAHSAGISRLRTSRMDPEEPAVVATLDEAGSRP